MKKSIVCKILVLTLSMGTVLNVQATTIEEAQQKAEQLDEAKSAAEAEKNALAEQLNQIIEEMNEAQQKLSLIHI